MIRILKKFNKILDRRKKKIIVAIIFLMIIGALLEVFSVSMMVPLLTAIMQPNFIEENKYAALVCNLFDLHSERTFVILCIGGLILLFVIKDIFLIFEYYVQSRFVYNNCFVLQNRLFKAYLSRTYAYFLYAKTGEILQVIQGSVNQAFSLLTMMMSFLTESIISVALIGTIFVLSPVMTVFIALVLLIVIFIIVKILKPLLEKFGSQNYENGIEINKWITQAVSGIKEIKVTQTKDYFQSNYEKHALALATSHRKYEVLSNTPRLMIEMVSIAAMLLFVAFMLVRGNPISEMITLLGAVAMAAMKLLPSANRIVTAFNSISYGEIALDKVIENLKILESDHSELEPEGHPEKDLSFKHEVKIENLTFGYEGAEDNVLDSVNMSIPIGKSVGIVGPSGAGKTTTVDILLGLLQPQSGCVTVDGQDIMTGYHSWLSHLNFIPQTIFMLDGTIRENIVFGQTYTGDDAVWNALKEAQLYDFVKALPDGLDTEIGERGVRISGGQRQRLGIARALYTNPDILFFDEATSALDNETEEAIMESIHALHGKKTMIIIAHRLTTIEDCDIVYRVDNKKITRER